MTVTAWVAAHTGLPSIYSDTAVRVSCGDRVLADGSGPVLLSDALAAPGVPTTYTVGSETVTLTRASGAAWGGLVTDAKGRGVPCLIMSNNEDPSDWKSTVSRFSSRSRRWSLEDNPVTGAALMVLTDPTLESVVWDVVRRRSVLVIGPAAQTVGVPMRCVTVDSVGRKRIGADGTLSFEIHWTEALGVSGAAPVVTWGEWRAWGDAALAKWGVTDSTVEVRRNYAPPVSSRWSGDGGTSTLSTVTGASDGPGNLPTYTRKTWTVIGYYLLDIAFSISTSANAIPVTPGEVWTHSLYLRSSRTISYFQQSEMAITYHDSSGVQVGSIQYGTTDKSDVVAGEWHRYWVTSTVPTGATSARVWLRKGIDKAQWAVGDYLECGASLSEKTAVLGDAFDGSYSPDPTLTPSWTGTANASASVLKVASGWQHYSALDLCRLIAGMPA